MWADVWLQIICISVGYLKIMEVTDLVELTTFLWPMKTKILTEFKNYLEGSF